MKNGGTDNTSAPWGCYHHGRTQQAHCLDRLKFDQSSSHTEEVVEEGQAKGNLAWNTDVDTKNALNDILKLGMVEVVQFFLHLGSVHPNIGCITGVRNPHGFWRVSHAGTGTGHTRVRVRVTRGYGYGSHAGTGTGHRQADPQPTRDPSLVFGTRKMQLPKGQMVTYCDVLYIVRKLHIVAFWRYVTRHMVTASGGAIDE
ncbi:hypothetical protein C8T65DRAFT_703533 [Cerioporus squamosus]|nr:hypothetical protein C8T65DRAFT_703533 [Cerioporus squamosus]